MRKDMNIAASSGNNDSNQSDDIDRLPPEDDEFRQITILQLPRAVDDKKEDGKEKVEWSWHVIEVPESLLDLYEKTNEDFNQEMDSVADQDRTSRIHAVKEHQKLVVKKRGEAKKPGLYLEKDGEDAILLAYVLESGKGKLSPEDEEKLDNKYFQDNKSANDNEQDDGLDNGGDKPDGISPS